ncbi:hypothetical protein IU451_28880 [Nocardia cyriacigeorgica]|uniref:hypothetical protein n=1 Tax=Nocardia cyriacigeorgica TaxID=135487 RepID=UPI0018957C15|nr:hypothetical protein [Nocardia cyriacigeorgica]MBF6326518.1 hypothetical protein [Nocardia cyriacigeorgica]
MTIEELRDEMRDHLAHIRRLETIATVHGYDYTGKPWPARVRTNPMMPSQYEYHWVKPSGPSVGDMIAYRYDAIAWIVREINIHRGIYTHH